jgi:solute:Na+ symporter, SSS family
MFQLYRVLAVIVVALLSVAIDRTIRVKTKTDYLLVGRSPPPLTLALALLTSWIGAVRSLAALNACRNGFRALWA